MIHLVIFNYNPLPRITNLGWQKAQTKSHSLLSSSQQEQSKKKQHTHLTNQKRWMPNQQLLLYIELSREKTEVPLLLEIHKPVQGHFGQYMIMLIERTLTHQVMLTSDTSTSITSCGLRFEASQRTSTQTGGTGFSEPVALVSPSLSHRVFSLGFVALPRNLMVLWPSHHKPCGLGATSTQISILTWPPQSSDSMLVLWPNQQTLHADFSH
jgi:hypothetical protein